VETSPHCQREQDGPAYQQFAFIRHSPSAIRPQHAAGRPSTNPTHVIYTDSNLPDCKPPAVWHVMLVCMHALFACCSIPESTQATATFLAKADGVLAGLAVANMVCEMVDPSLSITWSLQGNCCSGFADAGLSYHSSCLLKASLSRCLALPLLQVETQGRCMT
jgi:hypothetical protein